MMGLLHLGCSEEQSRYNFAATKPEAPVLSQERRLLHGSVLDQTQVYLCSFSAAHE